VTTIAVVIPCRNEAETIGPLLDALAAQTRPPDVVVVVDDASTDRTAGVVSEWAAAHPALPARVVASPRRGAGAAMNAGIAAVDAGIIVRLDGHSRPAPDYVRRSEETLFEPGAGVAGGVWRLEAGGAGSVARGIAAALRHPLASGGADYRHPASGDGRVRLVDTVPFGAFRRALWEELDGFDEALLRNQDYDFNYRARLAGHQVVLNPQIVSVYRARGTIGALARQYYQYGYWKVQALRKHPRALRLRALLPLLLVPSLTGLAIWLAATGSTIPLALLLSYPALLLAGALQASVRARDVTLTPFVWAAMGAVQLAWSSGASVALLSRRPVARSRAAR
jgi:glycosyltransferase involved in cell wall biosynthesis